MECVNKVKPTRTGKEWREANKDAILDYHKEYYKNNKETISQKQKQKHICACGCNYTFSNKTRHERSQKHLNFFLQNNEHISIFLIDHGSNNSQIVRELKDKIKSFLNANS